MSAITFVAEITSAVEPALEGAFDGALRQSYHSPISILCILFVKLLIGYLVTLGRGAAAYLRARGFLVNTSILKGSVHAHQVHRHRGWDAGLAQPIFLNSLVPAPRYAPDASKHYVFRGISSLCSTLVWFQNSFS